MDFDQPDDTRPPSRVFFAGWPGTCECGADFDEGDELRYDADGDLVAVGCCGIID